MTGCAERASRAMKDFNGEEAERLLFHLYTGLPLLPAAEDGGRCAVLARFGSYEVRLTEFPPDSMPFLPLWVELYRESGRVLVDGWAFLRSRTPSRPCKSSWSGRSGCTTGADLCGAEATLPGGSRGRGTYLLPSLVVVFLGLATRRGADHVSVTRTRAKGSVRSARSRRVHTHRRCADPITGMLRSWNTHSRSVLRTSPSSDLGTARGNGSWESSPFLILTGGR